MTTLKPLQILNLTGEDLLLSHGGRTHRVPKDPARHAVFAQDENGNGRIMIRARYPSRTLQPIEVYQGTRPEGSPPLSLVSSQARQASEPGPGQQDGHPYRDSPLRQEGAPVEMAAVPYPCEFRTHERSEDSPFPPPREGWIIIISLDLLHLAKGRTDVYGCSVQNAGITGRLAAGAVVVTVLTRAG